MEGPGERSQIRKAGPHDVDAVTALLPTALGRRQAARPVGDHRDAKALVVDAGARAPGAKGRSEQAGNEVGGYPACAPAHPLPHRRRDPGRAASGDAMDRRQRLVVERRRNPRALPDVDVGLPG